MHTLAHRTGKLPGTNFMFLNFLKQITARCLGVPDRLRRRPGLRSQADLD